MRFKIRVYIANTKTDIFILPHKGKDNVEKTHTILKLIRLQKGLNEDEIETTLTDCLFQFAFVGKEERTNVLLNDVPTDKIKSVNFNIAA